MAKKSSNKNWIQKAIKRPGAFTKKAENKNMSVSKFASKVTANPKKYDLRTVRQANLAKTLRKFQPGGDRALPTGAMTSTLSSPGLGSLQAQQQIAMEMQDYAKAQYEEQKAKQKAAEEAKKQQLEATAATAGSKETFDLAQKGIEAFRAGRAAKKAGDVAQTVTTAGEVAGTAAKAAGTAGKVANTGVYNPVGLGLNLAGSAIQAASDDNDPTKYNAGETTGTLMKGAGTGLGMAGTLTALAPALAIPGIGWAAAGVGALTAGAIALHRRNKARKEQAELDSKKAAEKSRLNSAFSDSWNQAFTRSGMDMGYNVGNSATNSYVPGQQQMMQTGGANTASLLSSLNQVDASKPLNEATLSNALRNRPSKSALVDYTLNAYSDPRSVNPNTLTTNPYVLTSYQKALQQRYQAGGVVPGGEIRPLSNGAVEFVGRTHKEGGIMIDPNTEVENGETMDKVNMIDKQGDYIFSNYLKLGGKTFAQRHKEILNRKGSQKEIQNLAKMQEAAAAKDGEKGRTPKKIMQTAGEYSPEKPSYFQGFDYAIQPRTAGKIPMEGDIDQSNWKATLGTPWAQNLGLNPNMTQEQLMQFYKEEYTPMIQKMAEENPDEFIARAKAFAFSKDPNAKYIRKQFNDDGTLKEGGLDKLVKLATDTQVGPYHAIFTQEREQPTPTTPPGSTIPEDTPKPEIPKETPEPEKPKGITPPKDIPILPLGWAQLAGPIAALRNPPPDAQMAYTSPVGRINLPRVNYNAERAAGAANTNAMMKSIENTSSGPAAMATKLALMDKSRERDLEIANAEAQVNKGLMAEEASENLKADIANAQIGADMSQFNAQLGYQSALNKRDDRVSAVNQIGNILTEIGKGYRQDIADERVARAVQLNGEYDRERMKSAARLRNTTVNYGGKDVKFRDLSPQQQNEVAAAMYIGVNDPNKAKEFLEQDKKVRAAAATAKETTANETEEKKRGGKYISKFGKINKRTKKAK